MSAVATVELGWPDPVADQSWRQLGECVGMDPDFFYPSEIEGRATNSFVAEAQRVCAGCPVRAACGEYAIRANEKQGVWGGLSAVERRRIRSRRRVAPAEYPHSHIGVGDR